MKRASYRLAYRDAQSVTDIAMEAGYDAPDAFARAFGNGRAIAFVVPEGSRLGTVACGLRPLDNARSKLMQKTLPMTT